jgi:hypothetical protein
MMPNEKTYRKDRTIPLMILLVALTIAFVVVAYVLSDGAGLRN